MEESSGTTYTLYAKQKWNHIYIFCDEWSFYKLLIVSLRSSGRITWISGQSNSSECGQEASFCDGHVSMEQHFYLSRLAHVDVVKQRSAVSVGWHESIIATTTRQKFLLKIDSWRLRITCVKVLPRGSRNHYHLPAATCIWCTPAVGN